jgi:hypothetical protein
LNGPTFTKNRIVIGGHRNLLALKLLGVELHLYPSVQGKTCVPQNEWAAEICNRHDHQYTDEQRGFDEETEAQLPAQFPIQESPFFLPHTHLQVGAL